MGQCKFSDGTIISDYGKPYFVAEINSSHNGNIGAAKKMIDAAVSIGCDCVKFQSWSAKSLYSQTYYNENPIAKRFVDKFSLTSSELKEMAIYCQSKGISFSSTPYCEEEVDFLVEECNVPYIKIASMELDNIDFLKYIGSKKVPVVLSTGMGEIDEIKRAVEVLESAGVTDMVILHCVSVYPVKADNINLNNILGLRKLFPHYPIGFSDHTEGDAAAVAAVALGAALIEKHLTLDKKKIGMDNGMATEPEQFSVLVDKCKTIQIGLGSEERCVIQEEYEQRKKMRRSIIVTRDLPAGHIITKDDLYAKRPGTGIKPDKMNLLIGKTLKCDVKENTLLKITDIMEDVLL